MSRFDRASRRQFAARLAAAAGSATLPGWFTTGRLCGQEAAVATASDLLVDAVADPDPAAGFRQIAAGRQGDGRWVKGTLTSQEWRGTEWQHELCLYLPGEATAVRAGRPPATSGPVVLWIDGGNKKDVKRAAKSEGPPERLVALAAVAGLCGLPVAVIRQVPFQPIDGRSEDDLIAHTFDQFFTTGDPTWPLLVPMVKAAAAAITTVTDLAAGLGYEADGFVVTGASKRGWTTWLTAASDPRVKGIVPMVIDMLDMPRHIRLQVESFGAPSRSIFDYTSRGVDQLIDTPRGRELVGIVDPFSYRARLVQPKIALLGSNDPYWPLEAANLYLPQLPGPRWVSYLPNASHRLPIEGVLPTVAAMGRHVADIEPLPTIDWEFSRNATGTDLAVETERRPNRARLWTASSGSRDFRESVWEPRDLAADARADGGRITTRIEPPAAGLLAAFAQCEFGKGPAAYWLSSGVDVLAPQNG
jgi:PhoPQ-activated pathogenicity-related protein